MKHCLLITGVLASLFVINFQNHALPNRTVVASCATGTTFLVGYYLLAPHKPRGWVTSTIALGLLSRRLYWRTPNKPFIEAIKELLK